MKLRSVIIPALAVTLFTTGCSHKIHVSESQAATMSRDAVATLSKSKDTRLPCIKASNKMILKMRGQFAQFEKAELEENMRTLQPVITDTLIDGIKVYVITPKTIKPENQNRIAYYIHGGGYVMGSATDQTGLIMADELGLKTYSLDYSLAPEAKFPVAMNQALTVYKYLVKQYDAKNIVGYSTSAGCSHMLGMLLKAQQENLPMLRAISLLSPSIDLSGNGDSFKANEHRDIIGLKNQIDKLYLPPFTGTRNMKDPLLKDPFLSPIYGNYTSDFPPVVITTSTRDLFLSNSSRLYWKLKAAGVLAQLDVAEGMWHAFTVYKTIPESIAARKSAQNFLFNSFNSKTPATTQATVQSETDTNKQLVLRFINEVINHQHFELIDKIWAQNMVWAGGSLGEVRGIENYKKMMQSAATGSFSNMYLQVKDIITEGDKVVVYFTNSGKNVGDFMGNKATNKSAVWNGIGIYKIESGKIGQAWFSEDILAMYQQLGLLKTN